MTKLLHGWLRSAHHFSTHTHTHTFTYTLQQQSKSPIYSSISTNALETIWTSSSAAELADALALSLSEDRLLIGQQLCLVVLLWKHSDMFFLTTCTHYLVTTPSLASPTFLQLFEFAECRLVTWNIPQALSRERHLCHSCHQKWLILQPLFPMQINNVFFCGKIMLGWERVPTKVLLVKMVTYCCSIMRALKMVVSRLQ